MILENADGQRLNFIHIPRTGGRYVANILTNSGYDYAKDFPASGHRTIMFEGRELLHLNLKEENHLIDLCHIEPPKIRFTIIRNPVEKFISFSSVFESFMRLMNLTWKDMEVSSNFYEFMENVGFISGGQNSEQYELVMGLKNLSSNAYIDQRNFIDDTVNVWRFENGLGKNFVDWLNNLGLDVKLSQVEYRRKAYDKHTTEFTDNMMNILYDYFKDECQYFDYNIKQTQGVTNGTEAKQNTD